MIDHLINMENNKKYIIKNLSEKQLKVMKDALELYSRLGIMQFDKLIDHMFNWRLEFGNNDSISESYLKNRDMILYHCQEIRNLLVTEDTEMSKYDKRSHWSLGIGHPKTSKKGQIAYELEKDIDLLLSKINDRNHRSKLKLTDEEDTIVEIYNDRIDKIIKILERNKK